MTGLEEIGVLSKVYSRYVKSSAAAVGAGNRGGGTESRDAPRPDFPRKQRGRNLARLHRLRAKNTAHPSGGSKPNAWVGMTTSAEMHGTRHPGAPGVRGPARRVGRASFFLDPNASLPRLGPQLPPFHTRPGARCRGVESIAAAASLPTSELNSFSLRAETFLSRTTLTPYSREHDSHQPLNRHPQSLRPQGPPTR